MPNNSEFPLVAAYATRLAGVLTAFDWSPVESLCARFLDVWHRKATIWVCGNGGSAGNAIHWANDFVYPVAKKSPRGMRIQALSANPAVLTCLGNDIGYDKIYSHQLKTMGSPGDFLVVLSGSGNSPNILEALRTAKECGIGTSAIVGFDGGAAKTLADLPIHFPTDDMQVAEDAQMVVCHALVQALLEHPSRPAA